MIDFLLDYISTLNSYLGLLAIVVALVHGLIKKKNQAQILMKILYFLLGMATVTFSILLLMGLMDLNLMALLFKPVQFSILMGILLTLHLFTKPLPGASRKEKLCFYLGIFCFTLSVSICIFWFQGIGLARIYVTESCAFILSLFVIVGGLFPIILEYYRTRLLFSSIPFKYLPFLLVVISCYSLIALGVQNKALIKTEFLVWHIALFIPLYLSRFYPELKEEISSEISRKRYSATQVNGIEVEAVLMRLNDLLKIDKVFKNPEMNSAKIAKILAIPKEKLTEIIRKENLSEIKNQITLHRVEESKNLLLEYPEDPLIKIAHMVGYGSKNIFEKEFLEVTDLSPQEYRDLHLS